MIDTTLTFNFSITYQCGKYSAGTCVWNISLTLQYRTWVWKPVFDEYSARHIKQVNVFVL